MNEKGISLSILLITIIIMAIITSATLYVGMDSIRNVKMQIIEAGIHVFFTSHCADNQLNRRRNTYF